MSDTRWVQHKSGQGEQWEVQPWYNDHPPVIKWCVNDGHGGSLYLPSSEYVLVPAPKRWVDVTAICSFKNGVLLCHPEEGGHGWTIFTC
jgi:hypothetical protein